MSSIIIAFDGNVGSGKTTLLSTCQQQCRCYVLTEHSRYLPHHNMKYRAFMGKKNLAIQTQKMYFIAEHARALQCRRILQQNFHGIVLQDRSFLSFAAHIAALYSLGNDIRRWFLQTIESSLAKNQVIVPHYYIHVTCSPIKRIERLRAREASELREGTASYLMEQRYWLAVDRFHQLWALNFPQQRLCTIDTTNEEVQVTSNRLLENVQLWCNQISYDQPKKEILSILSYTLLDWRNK